VRSNLATAQRSIEQQTDQLNRLSEIARDQVKTLQDELQKLVEAVARSLQLATERDVESLRRKVSNLEKRVNELARESAAA
jgi:archaellum component FlaC